MNQTEQTVEFDVIWDATLDKLEDHNKIICETAPPTVCKFINDYVLLNEPIFCRSSSFDTDEYGLVIGRPNDKSVLFLRYSISDVVLETNHTGPAFSIEDNAVWLYDEFHKVEDHYQHHIIFSDGIELVIPFHSFSVRKTGWFED